MICEFRNKLEKYTTWALFGSTERARLEKETNMAEVLGYVIFTILVTMLFVWWLTPFKILTDKMKNIKFKCSKNI